MDQNLFVERFLLGLLIGFALGAGPVTVAALVELWQMRHKRRDREAERRHRRDLLEAGNEILRQAEKK